MVATATVAAGAFVEVLRRRQPAQFEGLVQVTLDGLSETMQLFLRIQETPRDGIVEQ